MPGAKEFRLVAEVLLDHVPDGTDIFAIELSFADDQWRVRADTHARASPPAPPGGDREPRKPRPAGDAPPTDET